MTEAKVEITLVDAGRPAEGTLKVPHGENGVFVVNFGAGSHGFELIFQPGPLENIQALRGAVEVAAIQVTSDRAISVPSTEVCRLEGQSIVFGARIDAPDGEGRQVHFRIEAQRR